MLKQRSNAKKPRQLNTWWFLFLFFEKAWQFLNNIFFKLQKKKKSHLQHDSKQKTKNLVYLHHCLKHWSLMNIKHKLKLKLDYTWPMCSYSLLYFWLTFNFLCRVFIRKWAGAGRLQRLNNHILNTYLNQMVSAFKDF